MYSGPTGNSIEKSATGIEFLRNSPNTNTGEWGNVWSVNITHVTLNSAFCLRKNLILIDQKDNYNC